MKRTSLGGGQLYLAFLNRLFDLLHLDLAQASNLEQSLSSRRMYGLSPPSIDIRKETTFGSYSSLPIVRGHDRTYSNGVISITFEFRDICCSDPFFSPSYQSHRPLKDDWGG